MSELKRGKGSWGDVDSVREMKATGRRFGSLTPWCVKERTTAWVETAASGAVVRANGRWETSGGGPGPGC
jgi:hypothetical protein